jgi:hypothetical protein
MATLSIGAAALAFVIGVLASSAGGAIGGVVVGGKALGNELAAMMGGFFGPLAGIGGLVIGFVLLAILG